MLEDNQYKGTEYVRSLAQQRFWVIGLENALRRIKSKFGKCRKVLVQSIRAHMAHQPKEPVEGNIYPFKNTGIEHFGRFVVTILRIPVKHRCFLSTCLISRAFHIEMVKGLETDACVMANTRIIARRGKPYTVISDNGKNCLGAARELKECLNEWNGDSLCERLSRGQIN